VQNIFGPTLENHLLVPPWKKMLPAPIFRGTCSSIQTLKGYMARESLGTPGLEVCVLLLQGWPTSQIPRATFLTVLQQRATLYTWAHMNVTPSLPLSHTYFCKARFIVNITHHQHDNDRTLQRHLLLCMLFSI